MHEWWQEAPEIIGADYDQVYATESTRTQQEVDFVIAVSGVAPGAAILDLGCGTGRHSVPLAQRGYAVTGFDISPTFLHIAESKAAALGVKVTWVAGDMRHLPFEAQFDLVINLFGSWGYFTTHRENLSVFREVSKTLRPGGKFILDFFNHDYIIRNFQPMAWWQVGDVCCLERRSYDIRTGRHNTRMVLLRSDGERKEWTTSVRGYSCAEIQGMLSQVGLQTEEVYGGYDKQPFGLHTFQLIVHAIKPR